MSKLEWNPLPGHESREPPTSRGLRRIMLWTSLILGIFFIFLGMNILPVKGTPSGLEFKLFMLWFGATFFLIPAISFVTGIIRENRRSAASHEIIPNGSRGPWLSDYQWDPKGAEDESRRKALNKFFIGTYLFVFLLPFNYMSFVKGSESTFFVAFTGLLDALTLIVLGIAFYNFLHYLKYGQSKLQFVRFPFFLGEKLNAVFDLRKLAGVREIEFILRCVQERYEYGIRPGLNRKTVCHEVYRDTKKLSILHQQKGMQPSVEIEFALPPESENLATHLNARPPRYWELEATAKTSGIDYNATFLVPVYNRPEKSHAKRRRQK